MRRGSWWLEKPGYGFPSLLLSLLTFGGIRLHWQACDVIGDDDDSSSISAIGKLLHLFGLIRHQTPSQLLPYVEPSSERKTALTSQLLCKLSGF